LPVHLHAVKCPSCGQPIQGTAADRVFLCQCGVLHTRDDEGTRQLAYEVAAPKALDTPPSALLYVPFWRLDSEVTIHYERSEGGFFHKLFGKDWKGGRLLIFVPAVEWDPGTYKRWSTALTSKPPKYHRANSFGAYERMPVSVEEGEAKQLADFLILTFEAEKPGVLQDISYEVKVNHAALLYLPFDRSSKDFRPFF
jgi:hypothetical protein